MYMINNNVIKVTLNKERNNTKGNHSIAEESTEFGKETNVSLSYQAIGKTCVSLTCNLAVGLVTSNTTCSLLGLSLSVKS